MAARRFNPFVACGYGEADESPSRTERLADLTRRAGYRAAMTEWIAMLARLNQWFEVAVQAMAIDERTTALDGLERSLAEHVDSAPYLGQYPSFRPLSGEPRFERLLREIKVVT